MSAGQWWACDKGCGFYSTFEEVSVHERFCQYGVPIFDKTQTGSSLIPVSTPLHVSLTQPPVLDIHQTIASMEEVIRRQQIDITVLLNENRRLHDEINTLHHTCMQQADTIRVIQAENSRPKIVRFSESSRQQYQVEQGPPAVYRRDGRQVVVPKMDPRASPIWTHVWT